MDWSEAKGGPRGRLIRKILGLRRGVAALKNRLTVEIKPVSARVLVLAGSGACSG